MHLEEVIRTRASVRSFTNQPVPAPMVKEILELALRAPSWGNKQCWRFIAVEGKVLKTLIGKASGQELISKACETAPYVIVLCADPGESGMQNDISYYIFDGALAMENLMLAAWSRGLGTCTVGFFDEKAVRGALNIPENIRVLAFTPLGYPSKCPLPRPRNEYVEVVYHNTWGKPCE